MPDDQRSPDVMGAAFVASAVCVGLVFLGVVVGMMLKSRREDDARSDGMSPQPLNGYGFAGFGQAAMMEPAMQWPNFMPQHVAQPQLVEDNAVANYSNDLSPTSIMRTLVLPVGQTVRLMQASGGVPWDVEIRVIQPAGALAQFSFDVTTGPNTQGSVIVPAGSQPQILRIPANHPLFARIAAGVDVMVSISGRQVRG